ncbi:MAG: hypothetical protein QOF48_555 [Verrucomicrobiota bacterium]|jgi:hypothetical protein
MKSLRLVILAALGLAIPVSALRAGDFADAVIHYEPGAGTSPRFRDPSAALGAPSQLNPFGDLTDPFDPPYGTNQIVSIGAGGSLVLHFHTPILNHPNNIYGYDFIVFGNTGFIITNDFDLSTFNWVGTPATDGSLFAQNSGETRVSVSRDGSNFYLLDPAMTPTADGPFPTDGTGDPQRPTLPGLSANDFAGATLEDIRGLYQGSAGGTPYDIAWAVDAAGRRVKLSEIHFIRIDVLSGKSEIDAVATVARKSQDNPKIRMLPPEPRRGF